MRADIEMMSTLFVIVMSSLSTNHRQVSTVRRVSLERRVVVTGRSVLVVLVIFAAAVVVLRGGLRHLLQRWQVGQRCVAQHLHQRVIGHRHPGRLRRRQTQRRLGKTRRFRRVAMLGRVMRRLLKVGGTLFDRLPDQLEFLLRRAVMRRPVVSIGLLRATWRLFYGCRLLGTTPLALVLFVLYRLHLKTAAVQHRVARRFTVEVQRHRYDAD